MREEHADVRLGFEKGLVERFFREAGLENIGYESLGMQLCPRSTTPGEVADIGIFIASGSMAR